MVNGAHRGAWARRPRCSGRWGRTRSTRSFSGSRGRARRERRVRAFLGLRAEGDAAPPARSPDAGDPDPVAGGAGADLRVRGPHRRARHRHRHRGSDAGRGHPGAARADRRLGPVHRRRGAARPRHRSRRTSGAAPFARRWSCPTRSSAGWAGAIPCRLQLITDGSDPNTAGIMMGYATRDRAALVSGRGLPAPADVRIEPQTRDALQPDARERPPVRARAGRLRADDRLGAHDRDLHRPREGDRHAWRCCWSRRSGPRRSSSARSSPTSCSAS